MAQREIFKPTTVLEAENAALALFEHAPHAIILHEAGFGRVLHANEAALRLCGFAREEAEGKNLRELLPVLPLEEMARALQGRPVDTTLRGRGGRLTAVSASCSRLTLKDGEVQLCFLQDRTREKHAETERIASEARFKTALDRLEDGFCLLAPIRDENGAPVDFRFTYLNPAAREALRVPSGESQTRTLRTNFEAQPAEALLRVCQGVLNTCRDASVSRIKLASADAAPIFALHACKHGEVVALTLHDETERVHYEQALASKERSLSALISHLPLGVVFIDLESGERPIVNDYALKLIGDDFSRNSPFDVARAQLHDLAGRPLPEDQMPQNVVMKTGQPYHSNQIQVIREGMQPVRIDLNVTPVRDHRERVVALVSVFADISERVKLEAQLSQAQRMEALGTLAGGIAHDFNNIAQAISGSLELARRHLKPDHAAYANICAAQKASARVTSLTGQLLSATRQRLEAAQTTGLGPLIEETATLLRSTIDKRITIETDIAKRLWPAILEPGRFQQCILNLALNARDAIEGNGKIIIRAGNVDLPAGHADLDAQAEPGQYVAISVSDNGCGIPPDVINRIFEPFFTTKPMGKGTGLGLSVVYANVRQVGGWVRVKSSPQGTTFTLYFPRGQRFTGPAIYSEPDDATSSGTERVLVVDDEPEIVEIAREILSDMGYAVEVAHDGQLALEMMRALPKFDIVLLDLTMPRVSGAETLKAIRAENLAGSVVVMSGFASGLETEDLIKLGADAFLPKPYSLSQLTKVVREQLDLHRAAT